MIAINVIKGKMEIDNTPGEEFITRLQLATIMSTLSPRDSTKRIKFKVDENRMMLDFLMEQNNHLSSKVEMLERENAVLTQRVVALESSSSEIQNLFAKLLAIQQRNEELEEELVSGILS